MTEFSEDFVIPIEDTDPPFPKNAASEQGFYAASLHSEDPISDSLGIAYDLETKGRSSKHRTAMEVWKEHQELINRDAVVDIITDPEIDSIQKQNAVQELDKGTFESLDLKDQFVQDVATRDIKPAGEEDIPLRSQDLESQDIFLNSIRDNMEASNQLQTLKDAFGKELNASTEGVIGSLLLDVLSPADLFSVQSAVSAKELGISVDAEDIFDTGVPTIDKIAQVVTGPIFNSKLFDFPRSVLFNGTLNRKVADVYENSTPEQQREILTTILEGLKDTPGTDFNKWLVLQASIEDPIKNPAGILAEDLLSFIGAIPVMSAIINPLRTARWYTTFESSATAARIGAKTASGEVPDYIPSKEPTQPSEKPSTASPEIDVEVKQPPTGEAPGNATEDVTEGLLNKNPIPKEDRASKVYDQSFEAKENGNNIARVDNIKFDTAFSKNTDEYISQGGIQLPPELIGKSEEEITQTLSKFPVQNLEVVAKEFLIDSKGMTSEELAKTIANRIKNPSKASSSKEYRQLAEDFEKSRHVFVPEVLVDDEGIITFLEGATQYAVLRDKGVENIPLSMSPESLINAHKHGLINDIPVPETVLDVPATTRVARPSVPPNSPAGVLPKANPVEASNQYAEAITDTTGNKARSLGATKGELIYDSVLPKLDIALDETFPNVATKLRAIDEEFEGTIKNLETDVFIRSKAERDAEVDLFLKTKAETDTGIYNQANSTVHMGRNDAEGISTYGRTNDYGWNSREDALFVKDKLDERQPDFPSRIVERNGQFFIEQEWKYKFDHVDRWMFDEHSMDSSFFGINTSAFTRTRFGAWQYPNTMRGDPDFAKEGFLSELNANNAETKFFGILRKEVEATPHKKELHIELNKVQEEQVWKTPQQFKNSYAHLSPAEKEVLANSYYAYKRASDYAYEITNKLHRNDLNNSGHKAVYNEDGNLLAFGRPVEAPTGKEVWDFDLDKFIPTPKDLLGRQVVQLHSPIRMGDRIFSEAIIGAKHTVNNLPQRTLPRVEGWVPRKNIENWYIDFVPNSLIINGVKETNPDVLRANTRTIGAGETRGDANKLIEKLQGDFPNGKLVSREAKEAGGDASVTDYQLFQETVSSSKRRGSRLPTINGFSRVEDPLQALADTTRTLTKNLAWKDFKDSFEESFTTFATEFFPKVNGQRTFPNSVDDLVLRSGATPEEAKRFKVAQRLMEQFKSMQYTSTFGDDLWRSIFTNIANTIEDVGWAGRYTAELSRELGKQGNLLVRAPKSLATNLFINLNTPKQWIMQPQQLLELNAISPEYRKRAPTEIPAIMTATLSRAPHLKKYSTQTYEAARKASLMDEKEFDKVVDAYYSTGMPQAVDLNQMLYGTWEASKLTLDPSKARQVIDTTTNIVKAPGKIGKNLGFTPAEMANNLGAWLFTLDRFKKNNPGVDWNTRENIARITADAWDINHSMIGRAGAMPFQNGALGALFQFVAIQQKGFMQLASSKTLTKQEKTQLAAARLALYGAYGIPLGAVGLIAIDNIVAENASDDFKAAYNANKGGFVDALTNTTLDIMFADQDTDWQLVGDSFVGKGKNDVTVSKILSPIPDSVPLYEMVVELMKFTDEKEFNPRFPFTAAGGSLATGIQDSLAIWNTVDTSTPAKLQMTAKSLSEVASGFNNYGKAIYMKQYRDKASRFGQSLGLDITDGEIFAQVFGLTTREESVQWEIVNQLKEREKHIASLTEDIFRQTVKMTRLANSPLEYEKEVNQLNALLTLGVKDEDRQEVRERVEKRMVKALTQGDIQQSLYEKLVEIAFTNQGEKTKKLKQQFDQLSERNPEDKETMRLLQNTGILD